MKNLLIFSLLTITMVACKKGNDEDPNKVIPPHAFLNQNMSGKVNGSTWNFKVGSVLTTSRTLVDIIFIDSLSHEDSCLAYSPVVLSTALDKPIKPGLYAVKQGVRNFTIINNREFIKDFVGAIEITSVNEKSKVVTGKIDVRKDDNNNFNGNFAIKMCTEQ